MNLTKSDENINESKECEAVEALEESQNLVQEPNEEDVIEGIDSEKIEQTNEVSETPAGKEKDTDKDKC